ncbi:regulator of nonsense transcripts 1 [Tritrichomonas foetus]|uniref:Regulator of nonsense transcripts 1 n=1 Tax=Tritrichomonas foetus TaxID=1144522 RepID=A0A1J4JWT4_9EUKA|nr:regulator of nonsense transcripts 1 [Tritrichomonas foetus]|eukprot:OHT03130.1 regulator of nonsense transcripts 1 [Tritrichomonas foetus]
MQNEIQCEYCGCNRIECLGKCNRTGLYFCNGKGSCNESHLVNFLKKTSQTEFGLPPENEFSKISFECYLCHTKNIFQLGFVSSYDQNKFYIICNGKCLHDSSFLKLNIDQKSYQNLVDDEQINTNIIKEPLPIQYTQVSYGKIKSVLEKNYQAFGIKPEKKIHQGLPQFQLKYDDPQLYIKHLHDFLKAEKIESQNRISQIYWNDPCSCSFICPARSDFYKDLKKYNTVKFSTKHNITVKGEKAQVIHCEPPKITVQFQKNSQFYQKVKGLVIEIPSKDRTFREGMKALQFFTTKIDSLFQRVFLGNIDGDFNPLNKTKRPIPFKEPKFQGFPSLNKFQKKAIQKCLSQRFSMIQGPPGTGKTTLLVSLAYSLVKANVKPILVCAATNVAVDFATTKIASFGINVCRVMSSQYLQDEESEAMKPYSSRQYNTSSNSHSGQSLSKQQKMQAKIDELNIIRKADVVLSTCFVSSHRLSECNFKAILFDEAGQLTDPDLICGCIHNPKLIAFVGDHQQLGPIIKSKSSIIGKYDTVLLERLVLNGLRPSILQIQYRMHPAICKLPSKMFYNGLLKDGVTIQSRTNSNGRFNWPNKEMPIILWNVQGQEKFASDLKSLYNDEEARCIAQAINSLYMSHTAKLAQIGIITPYAAQQDYLIKSLPIYCTTIPKHEFDYLEIKSVDGFQGREKDYIIMSFVRSNNKKVTGFSTSRKRLCVSITRAKFGLIMIMNANTFSKSDDIMELIKFYRDNRAFVEGNQINNLQPSVITYSNSQNHNVFDFEEEEEDGFF